jgi:hypothetical protein
MIVGGSMKRSPLVLFLLSILAVTAQTHPTDACPFGDFDNNRQHNPQIAEVATKTSATTWMACDSPKGCISLRVDPGSPVVIYTTEGPWTCGYSADRHGAGPAWFRSSELRLVIYELNPPISAWNGTWTGGEDRVVIAPAKDGNALHLKGNATWHGANGVEHFGHAEGNATPTGNHLHLVEGGPDSCTIDLALVGNFILASDNELCGGINARFQGFWKRTPSRQSTLGKAHWFATGTVWAGSATAT